MKETVAVALSGGVDSAVAAAFLKTEGYRIIGLHFNTGYEVPAAGLGDVDEGSIPALRARRIAGRLGIPLEVIDCVQAFEDQVVRYFLEAYISGRTPNPCIVCNKRVKFGVVLEAAKNLGASSLATGHYARISRAEGKYRLLKGVDAQKDQSYFLSRLNQAQLSQAKFPLGGYRKREILEIARSLGLDDLAGEESQELCFVRQTSYKDFLAERRHGLGGLTTSPGVIVNTRGEELGRHNGLHAYTIGQRKGIGVPAPEPFYVLRLDHGRNQLVVGPRSELAARECSVGDVTWIEGEMPDQSISVRTRIRYRHREAESTLFLVDASHLRIRFAEAQAAITPGQAAAFYEGARVLGGGWIQAPEPKDPKP